MSIGSTAYLVKILPVNPCRGTLSTLTTLITLIALRDPVYRLP